MRMAEQATLDESVSAKQRTGQLPDRFDLGVLLVHGIGEQQRGDTLTETADAVVEWLRRRIEERHQGAVTLLDVTLRRPSEDDIAPAHLALHLQVRHRDEGRDPISVRWLIAESWWAEAFRASSFTDVALWGLTVVPWVVSTHVTSLEQRMAIPKRSGKWRQWVLAPVALLVLVLWGLSASVLALATAVLSVGLLLFRLIPLPFVPEITSSVQRTLAGGLGDAFVLVRSPVRFGAMTSSVQEDLRFLTDKCGSVAVIAHSQGTAVAWEAIRTMAYPDPRLPENLGLFVTYGQALRKLAFLRQVGRLSLDGHAVRRLALIGAIIAGALLLLVLLPFAIGPLATWLTDAAAPFPAVAFGIAAVLAATLAGQVLLLLRAKDVDSRVRKILEDEVAAAVTERHAFRWHDLWASADPVPNGPINLTSPAIVSTKLRNTASTVLDHVTYWQNLTEFVPIVAARLKEIGGLGEARAPDPVDAPDLKLAAMRRQARVLLLVAARLSFVFLAIAALIGWWSTLGDIGEALVDWVASLPLLGFIPDDLPAWIDQAVGVGLGVALALLAWQVYLAAWKGAIAADDRAFLGVNGETTAFRDALWTVPWVAMLGGTLLFTALATVVVAMASVGLAVAAWTLVSVAVPLTLTLVGSGGRRLGQADTTEPLTEVLSDRQLARAVVVLAIAVLVLVVATGIGRQWLPLALGIEMWLLAGVLIAEAIRQYRAFTLAFADIQNNPDRYDADVEVIAAAMAAEDKRAEAAELAGASPAGRSD
jgi:hypothetical protein